MPGTRRVHSERTAFLGFSSPTASAQDRSTTTKRASAIGSGTKCVASGMVTSAEPKPVMPKISAPTKANAARIGASGSTDEQAFRRAAVHVAQLRDVASERKPVARLQLLRALAQR